MLFEDCRILDENFTVHEHAYLGVLGTVITYFDDVPPAHPEEFGERYRGNGHRLIVPAFCSAHAHMPMSLLRGYGENESLMDWLHKCIFPFEAHLQADDIYWASLLSCAEAFRFGLASVSDMYFFGEAMARAAVDSGIKMNVCLSLSNFGDEHYADLPLYAENRALRETYHGAADGRVRVDLCLHSEYTTTERMVREVAAAARENGQAMQIHASESRGEVEDCRQRHGGLSPIEYLENCGVFDVPTTVAHGVHLSDRDIEILRDRHVTVATCPKSNLKLASGIAPIARLLEAGVNVSLSTDGVASNNNLNVSEELKLMSLLGKLQDPTALTPKQSLYAATRAGFIAQQRPDCGTLAVGNRADLTVWDTEAPYWQPCHNALNNLVFSAVGTDVCLTMIDGRVVYRDGEYLTLDRERILYEVEHSRLRILNALKQNG